MKENKTSLLQWMRFLGGKTRKDFEKMAKKNSELEEAYEVLDKLSADENKRLEYETRQRAIRDYNIGMLTAERRGIEAGRKIGITEGENRINQLNIELSKLPPEEKNETSLLQWMRFLGGKTRKDFEKMAKKNSELEEAYDVLDKLSADEKKRLEYETRQRAIRDYNIGMLTAERRGIENGRKIGIEEGRAEINQLILELSKLGRTEDITKAAADKEYQRKLLKEFGLH